MKTRNIFYLSVLSLFIALAVFAPRLSAQTFNATVVGKVTDANGASVPGAAVTITQIGTNRTQTATTNDDGEYVIPQLPPGTYTLKVSASGFKIALNENLVLETDTTSRVNVLLETGSVSETVTVTAEPSVVNTETSDKGEVITQKQVQDLPLNGRDFQDLALLVPGVYPRPAEDDQGQGVAAAGSRTDATNFILDGVTNRSDRNGSVGVNTSVDSIQEFKVSTSNYSAEFGRVGGAQINVVSKSGTNRYSGTLFEYVRNDFFDAIDVFADPEDGKALRRNQFGGSLGGPLPFFNFGEGGPAFTSGKDRTFFFVSFEKTLQLRSENALSTAPNAAWLTGDFSNVRGAGSDGIKGNSNDTNRVLCLSRHQVTQAVTKVECPTQNVIPFAFNPAFPTIIPANPVSLEILKRIPAANVAGSLTGYRASGISDLDRNQFLMKFDHRASASNNVSVRYSQDWNNTTDPFPSARNFYPTFGRTGNQSNKSLAISDVHTFSAKIINEFRLGYYHQHSETLGENSDQDYVALLGIPGLPTSSDPDLRGYPAIRIDGFSEIGDRPNDPFVYTFKNLQFYNITTMIFGNHSFKVGADIMRPNYIEADIRNVRGDFRFRGRNTNPAGGALSGFYSFADFLYGLPDATQRQIGADPANLRGWQYAFFVQDDWRVTPWLTLNLGVRYDRATPLYEKNDRLSNFIPSLGINVCASGEIREPNGTLVCLSADSQGLPRSLVNPDKNNLAPRVGFALRPFNDDKTVVRGGAGIFYSMETINPARQMLAISYPYVQRETYSRLASNLTLLSWQNPYPSGRGGFDGVTTPSGVPTDSQTPEVYQFNLTMEREIIKDLALEVGYVGTLTRHLGMRYNLNTNYPQSFTNGALVLARPYPTLGDITYQVQGLNSSYHGLQTSLRRRSRNGLTLLLSYTFSKAMDQNSNTNNSTTGSQRNPQDVRNWRAEWGLSDFHRAHQFSGSFNYDLPFGKGKRFFRDAGGLTNAVLGGWQLNGVVSYLTGRPFTPTFVTTDVTQQRPDLIGDPYANIPEGFYFNPFAFARPVASAADPNLYGSSGRNVLIGPTFSKTDLSLFKNFRLAENTRLQLRWEVFNVFNHANFKLPTFLLPNNISAVGATPAITLEELRTTTNVGRPTELATQMREMQFAIRLIF
jgi:outer membrane receptor protein involved in Fe transport